jgi:predicted nucleic acid-binding protein
MAAIIGTSILLYAANRDSEGHPAAAKLLGTAAKSPEQWFLTEGIVYGFLRVTTHPKVFPKPLGWKESMRFLKPFLESSNFLILTADERHWPLLDEVLALLVHPSGNLFFDIRTAVLMREHGIKRYTRPIPTFYSSPESRL